MRHNKDRLIHILVTMVCMIIILLVILLTPANAYEGEQIWTARQIELHEQAEAMRAAGCSEAEIAPLSAEWWQEQEDLNIIARVVQGEAGACPWMHQLAVAAVVCNRVKSPYFPDTVREVVAQPGQYLVSYTYGFDGTSRMAYLAAKAALDGEHDVPEDAYWQDNHVQGKRIWKAFTVDTKYGFHSVTYICCGIPGVA